MTIKKTSGKTGNSQEGDDLRLNQSFPGLRRKIIEEEEEEKPALPISTSDDKNSLIPTTARISIPIESSEGEGLSVSLSIPTSSLGTSDFFNNHYHSQRDLPTMMANLITIKENEINPTLETCLRNISSSMVQRP